MSYVFVKQLFLTITEDLIKNKYIHLNIKPLFLPKLHSKFAEFLQYGYFKTLACSAWLPVLVLVRY